MKIEYKIFGPSGSSLGVFNPIGNTSISGEKEEREFFYNKKLSSLTFNKEGYDKLIVYENELNNLSIRVCCGSKELFKGTFNMQAASICKDRCTIEVDFIEDSIYECVLREQEDFNIIGSGKLIPETVCYTINFNQNVKVVGRPEFIALSAAERAQYGQLGQDPVFANFAFAKICTTAACNGGVPTLPPGATLEEDNCAVNGTYVYSTPYPGAPLFDVTGNAPCGGDVFYAVSCSGSPPFVSPCDPTHQYMSQFTVAGTACVFYDPIALQVAVFGAGTTEDVDRGYPLKDVLQCLIDEIECDVNCFSSNFFCDPVNYVTNQQNQLDNIMIFQTSDITGSQSSNPATFLNLNFPDFYQKLKDMFNLTLKVDNGCIVLEHISRAINEVINIEDIGEVLVNPCCFSVDREEIPRRECWEWENANGLDFSGFCMEYKDANGEFYSISDKDKEEYDLSCVSTDIDYLWDIQNDTPNADYENDHFFLAATIPNGAKFDVISGEGCITGSVIGNEPLSMASLQKNYWQHDRYLAAGFTNDSYGEFASVKPYRKNEAIQVRVCCDDFANLDFECKYVKTDCGTGCVESFTYDLKTSILTINLVF